jgi:hypothetical protein
MGVNMRDKIILGGVLALSSAALVAAAPRALAPANGGLWQVAYSARLAPAASVCIADPIVLAQWEHRGGRCSPTVLSDSNDKVVISYTCADGGMGRSEMTLLTPRTIRIATQGISAGGPFNYVLHARRAGNCNPR